MEPVAAQPDTCALCGGLGYLQGRCSFGSCTDSMVTVLLGLLLDCVCASFQDHPDFSPLQAVCMFLHFIPLEDEVLDFFPSRGHQHPAAVERSPLSACPARE